ncbi:myosin-binding protein 2-like [Quillaja saponaria]|uniref:Myosin-binding protein 2-like n=1 Tax=Quillaja saponaria TaxID=32244 RepID=A0AAD7PRS5_QUISA|nr:myosin-binding protein 2-like [Quillaja saponaria]
MAANKFATMLSRNTHRIFVILVYAVLEWVLIMLLLLNSLFSYIITKFAKFFGLAPPCPWCSRVDRILEPGKSTNSYRDLACETHAAEISKLGYCSNHRKLAETQSMCEDCLASRPNHIDDTIGMTHKIALLSWVSENRLENGEKIMRCSCCNESLSRKLYPSYLLLKPSWGDVNYTQKAHLIVEAIEDKKNEGDHIEHEHHDDEGVADEHQIFSDIESFISREVAEDHSSSISNLHYDEKEDRVEKEGGVVIEEEDPCGINNFVCQSSDTTTVQDCFEEDKSLEVMILHSPNYISCDTNRLIPVELIDSSTTANLKSCNLESQSETGTQLCVFLVEAAGNAEKTSIEELDLEMNTARVESASVLNFKEGEENLVFEVCGQFVATQRARTFSNDGIHVEVVTKELDDITPATQPQAQELGSSTSDDDDEIPNAFDEFMVQNNISDQPQAQELDSSFPCVQEDQSSTSDDDTETPNAFDEFMAQNNLFTPGTTHIENSSMLEETNLVEKKQEGISHQLINSAEAYGVEEDKLPETPTSLDGFHYLHKKLMLLEKRESAEESLDGSVVSEVEGGDPLLTIERLKATLKAERKALSALYQELEEERSASAIATNQTMAMITRLQEEKAAMQMEALQYQRMMEEQSEYDQEALQLLNELMVKREKEKQEVEKELELYRNKVLDYESKEIEALRRMRDGSERSRDSSSSCSNMGDTEDLSIDLNREARDEDNGF